MSKANIILLIIIAVLVVYILMIGNSEPKEIIIPSVKNSVVIDDPMPVVIFDTIYLDSIQEKKVFEIVKVKNPVNTELLSKYEKAIQENDSLKQIELFKEAITERTYTEYLEDSVQTITVDSKVIGVLKRQTISYITKVKKVTLKPVKLKPSLFIGAFLSVPVDIQTPSNIGVNITLMNKTKNKYYSIGIDNKKYIYIGVNFKLF